MGHLVVQEDQISQAGPAFHEPMQTGPDHLVVLYVSQDGLQNDLLHNLHWHQGQADRPVVPRILLLALLTDGYHIC